MNGTLKHNSVLVALLGTLALASTSLAQPRDDDDIRQTVVRVAYLSGNVSYSRGDDPDDWQPASLNFPMTLGDRLYTAGGSRMELQTEGGAIYLAPETDLAALNLTDDAKQFSLGIGSAWFRVQGMDSGGSFEVDTPNAAVTFDRGGEYRIDVDRDGNSRVLVNRGYAYVASAGGEVPLEAGRLMVIDGIDSPVYDIMALPRRDSFDQWVETRARRSRDSRSRHHVSAGISGVDDLDEYGRWSEVPEYGTCWSPANVSADWQPYRAGRWAWQDPWGWSWVSNEPWGWAPYHYGRWVRSQARWYWVPVGPDVRAVRYAPALVAFVGGPGFSMSISLGGGGYVGWFPLAPRDPFVPWWGSQARETNVTNVTNITYVNRTYVTVINQNTFVSGAPVARNTISDARVVRAISAAPVVRGSLQVVPARDSIRVSAATSGSVSRPPTATINRAVVTRRAPAPAPARFQEKEKVIRENRGAPVDPVQAARLSPESQPIRPTRSVVVEPGRVTLAPKNARREIPAPEPVNREVKPGQARREAPPAETRDLNPGQARKEPAPERRGESARPVENEERRQQEADRQRDLDARKQRDKEVASGWQKAHDSRSQQEAKDARQQGQELEKRKQLEAAGARKPGQAADTKRQPESARTEQKPEPRAKERQSTEGQEAAQPVLRDEAKEEKSNGKEQDQLEAKDDDASKDEDQGKDKDKNKDKNKDKKKDKDKDKKDPNPPSAGRGSR